LNLRIIVFADKLHLRHKQTSFCAIHAATSTYQVDSLFATGLCLLLQNA